MRIFWDSIEQLDRSAFLALDKLGDLRGKSSFRQRMEKQMETVRKPQKAITFDA